MPGSSSIRSVVGKPAKRYAHLALRPYPEEYVRAVELRRECR